MVNGISASAATPQIYNAQMIKLQVEASAEYTQFSGTTDVLDLGQGGSVSSSQSMNIVYERAMAKLSVVVEEANAELGVEDGAVLDTSAEATANRIADFALNFFEKWVENDESRSALGEEEARQQFADFIGGAIDQGIQEASDILGALNALDPGTEDKITSISDLVHQRLDDFVANGL